MNTYVQKCHKYIFKTTHILSNAAWTWTNHIQAPNIRNRTLCLTMSVWRVCVCVCVWAALSLCVSFTGPFSDYGLKFNDSPTHKLSLCLAKCWRHRWLGWQTFWYKFETIWCTSWHDWNILIYCSIWTGCIGYQICPNWNALYPFRFRIMDKGSLFSPPA